MSETTLTLVDREGLMKLIRLSNAVAEFRAARLAKAEAEAQYSATDWDTERLKRADETLMRAHDEAVGKVKG